MGVPGTGNSMCQGTEGRECLRGPRPHQEFTGPASESSGSGDAGEGAGGGMDQVTGGKVTGGQALAPQADPRSQGFIG